MCLVPGVGHGFKEVCVTLETIHIFSGGGTDGPDKARIWHIRACIIGCLDLDHMVPVVAEVANDVDGFGTDIFTHIQQAGFVRGQRAIEIAVRIGHAPCDTSGPELIEVTVGPPHGWQTTSCRRLSLIFNGRSKRRSS